MSLYFYWDSGYESNPGSGLPRNLIAQELRNMKPGIRSMMEVEHNWGPFPPKDDGSHWGGHVTIATAATNPSALTLMLEGSLFINNTGTPYLGLYVYHISGGAGTWLSIGGLDHGSLVHRDQVALHDQYLAVTGGLSPDTALNMGGKHVFPLSAPAGTNSFGAVVLFGHRHTKHVGWGGTSGAMLWGVKHNAINPVLGAAMFAVAQTYVSGTINAGTSVNIALPYKYMFTPKILVTGTDTWLASGNGGTPAIRIYNNGGAAISYRIEYDYIPES